MGNVESRTCGCSDWINNIDKINAPFKLGMSAIGQYTGRIFSHCPWCGMKLGTGPTREYKISIDWQVYGEVIVEARSLEEAIRIIEKGIDSNGDIAFPTDYENVENSMEVNYDVAQAKYPDEEIDNEPIHAKGSLTCPECGGKLGKHMLSCSTIGGHL